MRSICAILLPMVCFLVLFFGGCTSYFQNGYRPEALEERKIQATRKAQITKDNKIETIIFVTYLNDIEHSLYKNFEYFFIEIYNQNHDPVNLSGLKFSISTKQKDVFESLAYMRKIEPSEYDSVFKPLNKWSSCYLVAFAKSPNVDLDNIKLRIEANEEVYLLDFGFKIIPFQAW